MMNSIAAQLDLVWFFEKQKKSCEFVLWHEVLCCRVLDCLRHFCNIPFVWFFFPLNVQVYDYSVPAQTAPCLVSVMDGFNFHLLQFFGDLLRFLFLPLLFLLKRENFVPP